MKFYEKQPSVYVVIKDGKTKKSKTLTVYETTVEDMVKAITKMVENQ